MSVSTRATQAPTASSSKVHGSHGRFHRVGGRNSAIRFVVLEDHTGFCENMAGSRSGGWEIRKG